MGKRGPRLLLEKQSVERRERFRMLWESKNTLVRGIAAEFGVSERTAYAWAKAEGLHRHGRGYSKEERSTKQAPKRVPFAGKDLATDSDPYDRTLVNGIDAYFTEPAIATMQGEKPYRIAEAVFREYHNTVKDAGPPISLDETGQFVKGNQPEPVKGDSADFKVLRRRIARRLTQARNRNGPEVNCIRHSQDEFDTKAACEGDLRAAEAYCKAILEYAERHGFKRTPDDWGGWYFDAPQDQREAMDAYARAAAEKASTSGDRK